MGLGWDMVWVVLGAGGFCALFWLGFELFFWVYLWVLDGLFVWGLLMACV